MAKTNMVERDKRRILIAKSMRSCVRSSRKPSGHPSLRPRRSRPRRPSCSRSRGMQVHPSTQSLPDHWPGAVACIANLDWRRTKIREVQARGEIPVSRRRAGEELNDEHD